MASDAQLAALGAFLRARRAEVRPGDVSLTSAAARRRVPGLRREEVAQLASISTDYYTRVEQGRIRASAPVLESLARALRLDPVQTQYLFGLAGKEFTRAPRPARQVANPQLVRLMDDLATWPALVLGNRMEVLAWNAMAAELIIDFGRFPPDGRNYLRLLFAEPSMRERLPQWEIAAADCVAHLRMEAGRNPEDPDLALLVGELSVKDPDFRRWWGAHHVAGFAAGVKEFQHPTAGRMTLDWQTLTCAAEPDQGLVYWTAEAGSPSHQALMFLASWASRRQRAPQDQQQGDNVPGR